MVREEYRGVDGSASTNKFPCCSPSWFTYYLQVQNYVGSIGYGPLATLCIYGMEEQQ